MFEFPFPFMPPDLSTHGGQIDSMIWWLHILMAVLFVGWGVFFVYTLVRFRAGSNPKADHEGVKSHFSTYHEVAVVVVECLLLFALAVPIWASWVEVGQATHDPGEALEVNVIAQQFAWNVHYPGPDGKFGRLDSGRINETLNPIGLDPDDPNGKDDIALQNLLLIPVDTPIKVNVTSKDVIHSFFLPVMRVKQDAIPGMKIPVGFQAGMTTMAFKKAEYLANQARYDALRANDPRGDSAPPAGPTWVPDHQIACAQLCGAQHYKMNGLFYILSKEDFADLKAQPDFGAWARKFRRGQWDQLKEGQ